MGEGLDETDKLIMPLIDQANIACGGHAGDKESITRTVLLAKQHGVHVGAHPSYVDPEHFGRRSVAVTLETLEQQLAKQIRLICEVCELSLIHI